MAKPIIKVSDEKMHRKMREYERVVGQEMPQIVKREARLLCVELGRQTQPFGNKKDSKDVVESGINVGLGGLFFSVDKVTSRTRNLLSISEAKAFRKANKRKGRAVRLHQSKRMTIMQADRAKLLAELKKRAGWAKAGWAKCAQLIGVTSNPLRGFPAWVKRHVAAAPGYVTDKTRSGWNPRVTFSNQVKYASSVISAFQVRNASNVQRGKMIRSMSRAIRYELTRKAGLA